MVNRRDMKYSGSRDKVDFQKEFDQMFPMPTEKRKDAMKLLSDRYVNYKHNYVKHLLFSPDRQNLSEFSQFHTFKNMIFFFKT